MYINRKYNAIITHSAEKINLRENYMAKAKKNDSGKWEIQATKTIDGKKIRKRFYGKTKKEAEYNAAVWANSVTEEKESDIKLADALKAYIESRRYILSPSTIEGYEKIKRNYFLDIQEKRISDITFEMLQKAVNELSKDKSAKTVNNAFALIKSVLKQYDISCENIRLPKNVKQIKQYPPLEDVLRAIYGSDVFVPCILAMWLSLRMSEVRGVKYGDIHDGKIYIKDTLLHVNNEDIFIENRTKSYQSTRIISFPESLRAMIGEGEPGEFIVKDTRNYIYKKLQKLLTDAGVPNISFHDLRHYNAAVMGQLGISDKYAMERGGWDTESIYHKTYQFSFDEYKEKADKSINSFFENAIESAQQSAQFTE